MSVKVVQVEGNNFPTETSDVSVSSRVKRLNHHFGISRSTAISQTPAHVKYLGSYILKLSMAVIP